MDNCWDYNGGESEVRMGKALRDGYREKVFLMTKVDGRTRQAASQQIDDSLRRLQTDHIDLDRPEILEQALEAVRTYRRLNATEIGDLLARTSTAAGTGRFELYKTSTHFDGTIKNPVWLG